MITVKQEKVKKLHEQFLVDNTGKKTAIVLPLKNYEELLEDIHDLAVIAERKDEQAISFDELKKRLKINDNFDIVGYSFVPITPFKLKDWEKFDMSNVPIYLKEYYEYRKKVNYRLDGFKSTKDGWVDFLFDNGSMTFFSGSSINTII